MHFEKRIRALEERLQIPVLLSTTQLIHIYIGLYTYKAYLLSVFLASSVFVFVLTPRLGEGGTSLQVISGPLPHIHVYSFATVRI